MTTETAFRWNSRDDTEEHPHWRRSGEEVVVAVTLKALVGVLAGAVEPTASELVVLGAR